MTHTNLAAALAEFDQSWDNGSLVRSDPRYKECRDQVILNWNKTAAAFTFTAPVTVTSEQICDQVCSAIEGGCGYWLETFRRVFPVSKDDIPNPEGVTWYGRNAFYALPNFEITFVEQEEHKLGAGREHKFNHEAVVRGLGIMAAKYGDHFADLKNDNGDATTADVFLQCCLFGELIYG